MNRFIFTASFITIISLLLGSGSRLLSQTLEGVYETRLSNGLQVLLMPNTKAPVVSVQVWYRVGSRNESLGLSGLAHLTEHLMFRGTKKYGPKQYSRIIQKNGGQDNAFTNRDYTAYYENLSSDRLGIALDLEADRMTGLVVDGEKFLTERKVVQEERRLRIKDDPSASLLEEVQATAFKSHPYRWPVTGWMEDLDQLTPADFMTFYKNYYQPANAALVIAGHFDKTKVIPLIEATFGRIPKGDFPSVQTIHEPPQEADKRIILRREEARLPYVILAYHVPSFPHPDSFPLKVMSQILAGGKSCRMYQKMVYEEQMALEAGVEYAFQTKDPYLFLLYAQAMPGRSPEKIEERLFQELEEWEINPPGQEEIERAKNQIEAGFIFAQDSIFYQGSLLGKYQTLGNWKDLDKFLPGIRAVGREDLLRVYQNYFKEKNKTVGILIPIVREEKNSSFSTKTGS